MLLYMKGVIIMCVNKMLLYILGKNIYFLQTFFLFLALSDNIYVSFSMSCKSVTRQHTSVG